MASGCPGREAAPTHGLRDFIDEPYGNLASPAAVALLRAAAERVASDESAKGVAAASRLWRALASMEVLDTLASAAHGYLRGQPDSEAALTEILARMGAFQAPQPVPVSFAGLGRHPIPGEIDFPQRFPLPRRGCFINKGAYSGLFAGIARWAQRQGGDGGGREQQWLVVGPLLPALEQLEALEDLYAEMPAIGALQGTATLLQLIAKHVPDSTGFGDKAPGAGSFGSNYLPTFPVPGFPGTGITIPNPCRLERWIDTGRASACICHESYLVTGVVNQSRPQPDGTPRMGEGCEGEWLRFEGEGFGDSREWPRGLGESEVLFSSDGLREGHVPATEYRLWSDTAVEARVPPGIQSGTTAMRILCRTARHCARAAFRHAAPGSRRYVTLSQVPILLEAAYRYPPSGDRRVLADLDRGIGSIPRCHELILELLADDAEAIDVLDEDGTMVLAGERGPSRRVAVSVGLQASESRSYIIRLAGGCGAPVEARLPVHRGGWLILTLPHLLRAGETHPVRLELFCAPASFGLKQVTVDLFTSDPEIAVLSEELVVFDALDTVKELSITAAGDCGGTVVEARVREGHVPRDIPAHEARASYHIGVITEFRLSNLRAPSGFGACQGNVIEVDAPCLPVRTGFGLEVVSTGPEGAPGLEWIARVARTAGTASVIELTPSSGRFPGEGLHRFRLRLTRGNGGMAIVIAESNEVTLTAAGFPRFGLGALTADPLEAGDDPVEGTLRVQATGARSLVLRRLRLRGIPLAWVEDDVLASQATSDLCDERLAISARQRYRGEERFRATAVSAASDMATRTTDLIIRRRPPSLTCIRIHAKIIVEPAIALDAQIAAMNEVFGPWNLNAVLASVTRLNLPEFEDVFVPTCGAFAEEEPLRLFSTARGSSPDNDVAAFYVASISGGEWLGCAAHAPASPSVTLVASAPIYTLAHEVCHTLGLRHVDPPDTTRLMHESATWTSLPPDLIASEVEMIKSSHIARPC